MYAVTFDISLSIVNPEPASALHTVSTSPFYVDPRSFQRDDAPDEDQTEDAQVRHG